MLESDALSITPEVIINSSEDFKNEVKKTLIPMLYQLLGKAIWWILPKKWKTLINAVIVYMENH